MASLLGISERVLHKPTGPGRGGSLGGVRGVGVGGIVVGGGAAGCVGVGVSVVSGDGGGSNSTSALRIAGHI